MADKWIHKAIKHHGAATAAAKKEGIPVHEWANKHQHDEGINGHRARLALTLHDLAQHEATEPDADEGQQPPPTPGMGQFH